MYKTDPYRMWKIIRYIINKNFTFADLSKRFKNVDSSTGNIYCPFHENRHSPAAKMYWDDLNERWVLHCFGECHRTYTAFDYVYLIMCKKYEMYRSPLDFLRARMSASELHFYIEQGDKIIENDLFSRTQLKEDYINKVAEDYEDTIDYIEMLYTA